MPSNKKKRVRARMQKTGETWQTANRSDEEALTEQKLVEATKELADRIANQAGSTCFITHRDYVEKVLPLHHRLGRTVTPLYALPDEPFSWTSGGPSEGRELIGYETIDPEGTDARSSLLYKFYGTSVDRAKFDEDDHDDLFVMLDAMRAHVASTGDTIWSADDPFHERIGFIATVDPWNTTPTRRWRLHIKNLRQSVTRIEERGGDAAAILDLFKTSAGKKMLAHSIAGQRVKVDNRYGDPPNFFSPMADILYHGSLLKEYVEGETLITAEERRQAKRKFFEALQERNVHPTKMTPTDAQAVAEQLLLWFPRTETIPDDPVARDVANTRRLLLREHLFEIIQNWARWARSENWNWPGDEEKQ